MIEVVGSQPSMNVFDKILVHIHKLLLVHIWETLHNVHHPLATKDVVKHDQCIVVVKQIVGIGKFESEFFV